MALHRPTRPRALPNIPGGLLRAQDGSFLVEAMVSSLIIVIIGLGVLESIDRSARLGGQQKAQAIAGNVAQSEQEQVRALPLSQQSNLRRASTVSIAGETYSIASRADWITDASGGADCTTSGASADYLKLSTVVTWGQQGTRKPVTLESLITPGVRSFGANQGSLAVQVLDRNGAGVSGLQLNLSGAASLSDTTNASGCVLWGYLTAGSGYTLGFSRTPDWVTPDGSQVVSKPVAVVGDQTSNVALLYDRGGYLRTSFVTRSTAGGADIATNPRYAHVTHTGGGGVSVSYPPAGSPATGSTITSGLLFPFSSPYTVQPDTCAASETPAVPEDPVPEDPSAPTPVTGLVTSGITTTTTTLRIPSPNIRVRSGSPITPLVGATVRVTTPCGTVIKRTTTTGGVLADPGYPYASSLAICASDGTRQVLTTRTNTNFNNSAISNIDITSSSPLGTCP